MTAENKLSSATADALHTLPFGSIIGAPLKACIEAQAMAARTSWKFIQEVGLHENPQTGEKEVVNVTFLFKQKGKNSQITVPLLTIVPIPYIAVQTVDINFKANIRASQASEQSDKQTVEENTEGIAQGKLGFGIFSLDAQVEASYSSKKDSKATRESRYSVEYTMDVAIKAVQDDMPAGLAQILETLNKSCEITPYQE